MPGADVTIPGDASHGDASSPAYANVPAGATRGMVVIHEIFGRQPDIDRVVDRFATRGYAAVAPDLFHEGALRCIRAVMSAMSTGVEVAPVRKALRARQWLCDQAGLATPQSTATTMVIQRVRRDIGLRRYSAAPSVLGLRLRSKKASIFDHASGALMGS